MRYELWAIEVDTQDGPALWRRTDEQGEGSPLTWETEQEARQVITETEQATGCSGELRPVQLTGYTATSPSPRPPDQAAQTSPFELSRRFLQGPDSYDAQPR